MTEFTDSRVCRGCVPVGLLGRQLLQEGNGTRAHADQDVLDEISIGEGHQITQFRSIAHLLDFQQAQTGVASKLLPRQINVRPARMDATLSGGPQMTTFALPDGLSALLARHGDRLLGLQGL